MQQCGAKTPAEMDAYKAAVAAEAQAKLGRKCADDKRMLSLPQWFIYMQTYVVGVSIIGGRLSPAILMGHIATMSKLLELLMGRTGINYKNAFLAYDEGARSRWKTATSMDEKGFRLSDYASKIDEQLLMQIERENPYGTAANVTQLPIKDDGRGPSVDKTWRSQAAANSGQYATSYVNPSVVCWRCSGVGHTVQNCPLNHRAASQGQPYGAAAATGQFNVTKGNGKVQKGKGADAAAAGAIVPYNGGKLGKKGQPKGGKRAGPY